LILLKDGLAAVTLDDDKLPVIGEHFCLAVQFTFETFTIQNRSIRGLKRKPSTRTTKLLLQ
jgi:hypothetical protein